MWLKERMTTTTAGKIDTARRPRKRGGEDGPMFGLFRPSSAQLSPQLNPESTVVGIGLDGES